MQNRDNQPMQQILDGNGGQRSKVSSALFSAKYNSK
jgi:hypothetical protein